MHSIYLDYAAATPLAAEVMTAMEPFLQASFYNPSAPYLAAKQVAQAIEKSRRGVAHWLGAKPGEIIFTAGGTEANNLAIHGLMRRYPGANLAISAIEHESVSATAVYYDVKQINVRPDGLTDLGALESTIDDKTVLISIMYANNEIGTIQPIRAVSQVLKKIRDKRQKNGNDLPLYFHTDACQAAQYLDLHVSRLGVDLMTLNGGKIYGSKQTGALFVRTGIDLEALISGGGQERKLRSGTENVAGIIGFAAALELVQKRRGAETERLKILQDLFFDELKQKIPIVVINGSRRQRLPNNVHLTIPGSDSERVMMALDERGIMCGLGSACSASHDQPSHVLTAIGLDNEAARSSLRFTMGSSTSRAAIIRTVRELAQLID